MQHLIAAMALIKATFKLKDSDITGIYKEDGSNKKFVLTIKGKWVFFNTETKEYKYL